MLRRFAAENPRRSLILFACGAAIGLGIAGYGLFTAAGTRISGVPPEDVALVNGRHILRSDFIAQTELETSLPFAQTTAEQRRKVLGDMLNEELLVQRGLETDLAASDPDVRMALATGVQAQVDADVLAQQPSEEILSAYYEEHKDKYAGEGIMALRDLIARPKEGETAEETAQRAAKAAMDFRGGGNPDAIAATQGLSDSGKIGRGDIFDFAAKLKLDPALYALAAKLQAGQAASPLALPDGVHVLLMEKRIAPDQRSFAEARDADRKSTRLNSSHVSESRMPSSA